MLTSTESMIMGSQDFMESPQSHLNIMTSVKKIADERTKINYFHINQKMAAKFPKGINLSFSDAIENRNYITVSYNGETYYVTYGNHLNFEGGTKNDFIMLRIFPDMNFRYSRSKDISIFADGTITDGLSKFGKHDTRIDNIWPKEFLDTFSKRIDSIR
ncbi:MAG: hypothetical protein PHS92_03875 [Candidatus Gracilibacteria bacterium]|nr:hypothetical protein [Candidatus Gracilibacteria bacterium]